MYPRLPTQWCGAFFNTTDLARSGGPNLKETQSYPATFCSKVASYHKKYCIESWLIMFEIILLIVGANPQEELFGW